METWVLGRRNNKRVNQIQLSIEFSKTPPFFFLSLPIILQYKSQSWNLSQSASAQWCFFLFSFFSSKSIIKLYYCPPEPWESSLARVCWCCCCWCWWCCCCWCTLPGNQMTIQIYRCNLRVMFHTKIKISQMIKVLNIRSNMKFDKYDYKTISSNSQNKPISALHPVLEKKK